MREARVRVRTSQAQQGGPGVAGEGWPVVPPRLDPGLYATWECEEKRNFYGAPVVSACYYEGLHYPALVPAGAGSPPVCSCGFTRVPSDVDGLWWELVDHLDEQAPGFASRERAPASRLPRSPEVDFYFGQPA
jgi:hypothetical protein